eukprot:15465075-Alexandrium_andersonii.AAC.1
MHAGACASACAITCKCARACVRACARAGARACMRTAAICSFRRIKLQGYSNCDSEQLID